MAKARSSKKISLENAVEYILQSQDSDINSWHGGMRSDEEENLNAALLGYQSDWDER